MKYLSLCFLMLMACLQDKQMSNVCDEAALNDGHTWYYQNLECMEKQMQLDTIVSENNQTCIYTQTNNPYLGAGTLECLEKTYRTQKVGESVIMAENLNFGDYNGLILDSANERQSRIYSRDWIAQKNEKFCVGDSDLNCVKYGALYQWHTALSLKQECILDERCNGINFGKQRIKGICPQGWHIPISSEWEGIVKALEPYAQQKMAGSMKLSFGCENHPWDMAKNSVQVYYPQSRVDSAQKALDSLRNSSHLNLLPLWPRCDNIKYGQGLSFWYSSQSYNDVQSEMYELTYNDGEGFGYKLAAYPVRCIKDE